MKALLDNDIILDIFLYRRPFVTEATALWEANAEGRFEAFVCGITPVNLFYIGRKNLGAPAVRQSVHDLLEAVQICPINQTILRAAFLLPFSDYEDAVQHASATASGFGRHCDAQYRGLSARHAAGVHACRLPHATADVTTITHRR